MTSDRNTLPFCKSPFLQDVIIELGRKLKEMPGTFEVTVDSYEEAERKGERLAIWVYSYTFTAISLQLWDEETIWVSVESISTKPEEKFQISFYPDCDKFTSTELVEKLRETISISSRLCYDETPVQDLRNIWRYQGEVEIEGIIKKRK
jgi:hypothetical protein